MERVNIAASMRDIKWAIALAKSIIKHPIRAIPLLIGIGLVFFGAQNYEPPTEPNEAQNSAPTQSQPTDSQGATAPQAAIAQNNPCPVHLPNGLPTGTPATNDLVVRDIYCLSSNDRSKFADWVAFRLDRATITGSSDQDREWEADPKIHRDETLEPEDFRGAYKWGNYDRGHLAPLASFRGKNWQQVNYLSNITPQKAALNRGTWKELEDYERDLVQEYGEVYVIVGTAYDNQPLSLINADEPNDIPDYFWRIIQYGNTTEAYLLPQETPSSTDFRQGKTTVQEIERWTGLNFGLQK
ncbi:DNA/RNA non-specific endonuclease (plasmid) [Picosynechococcus sp. PCC 7002]|nr:DNA/RNA non-specific endonuclease [Picosynechococcus sp. PCC 7002]